MSARRLVRATKKRITLGLLFALVTMYAGFMVFERGFSLSETVTLLKGANTGTDNVVNVRYEVLDPLDAKLPVSRGYTLRNRSSEEEHNAPKKNASVATREEIPSQDENEGRQDAIKEREDRKTQTKEEQEETEFLQRMAEVQRARHDLIRKRCADTYNITQQVDFQRDRAKILSWKKLYEHAYANDDFKFIICRVLKVGSFSWRKVIRSLWEKGSPTFKKKQKMGDYAMREYDNETFVRELESYTKVLFVREPFARLLSGYRDKYVELRHFPYYKPIGAKIIAAFREGATKRQISSGKPTFEEFIRWLVRNPDDRNGDFHWRPLFDWYHPCEMQYDYIGKLETATEDAKYIFKMLGIDKLESYPSTETHHTFSSAKEVLKQYYSQISPDLLPKIIYRYREEFVLYNYTVPQKLSDIWA